MYMGGLLFALSKSGPAEVAGVSKREVSPLRMDAAFIKRLEGIVGGRYTLSAAGDLRNYRYDGSYDQAQPEVVVLPSSAEEIAHVVAACNDRGYPYLARGAG